jgi:hypothetical protein
MEPGRVTLVRVAAWCYMPQLTQEKSSKVNVGESQVYQEGKTAGTASLERMVRCRRVESRAHQEYSVSRMQPAQLSERRSGDHWSRGSSQKLKMYTGRTETQSCNQHCFRSRDNRVFALDTRTFGTAARLPVAEKNSSEEAVRNTLNS